MRHGRETQQVNRSPLRLGGAIPSVLPNRAGGDRRAQQSAQPVPRDAYRRLKANAPSGFHLERTDARLAARALPGRVVR